MESEDSFSSVSVKEHSFFHLKLPAMQLAEWQTALAFNRVIIQREHLVGGDVEIPCKLEIVVRPHTLFIYRISPTVNSQTGQSSACSHLKTPAQQHDFLMLLQDHRQHEYLQWQRVSSIRRFRQVLAGVGEGLSTDYVTDYTDIKRGLFRAAVIRSIRDLNPFSAACDFTLQFRPLRWAVTNLVRKATAG